MGDESKLIGLFLIFCSIFTSILFVLPVTLSWANHGQEISIVKNSVDLVSVHSKADATKIDVYLNYTVKDARIKGQTINSVMKIYDQNGSLLKTSSSQYGFKVNETGTHHHLTTITNNTMPTAKAVVQFTDLSKTLPLSNPVEIILDFNTARQEISAFPS